MLLKVQHEYTHDTLTFTVLPVSGNFACQSVELVKSPQHCRAVAPLLQPASRVIRLGAAITTEARLKSHGPMSAFENIMNDDRKWDETNCANKDKEIRGELKTRG